MSWQERSRGPGCLLYQLLRMFDDAGLPLPPRRGTIKFHFCRGECLRISNKAAILFPSQRTTRPRRGVGSSFFVYSPANWFCGIHAPFHLPTPPVRPPSPPRPPFRHPPPRPPAVLRLEGRGRARLFRGTQIRGVRVRGVLESTRGENPADCHRQKSSSVQLPRLPGFLPKQEVPFVLRRVSVPASILRDEVSTGRIHGPACSRFLEGTMRQDSLRAHAWARARY